jgi:aryl-alcohol dehydrogenase-like predicted oxidoreductase
VDRGTASEEALMSATVPGTDLSEGRVMLGTMTFGDRVDAPEARRMIDLAYDHGIRWFDTANKYAEGRSERIVGEALRHRDDVVIATKVRHPVVDGDEVAGLAPRAIVRALDASLERLGRDRVDVLYLHQPDWDVPVADIVGAVDELVVAGKVGELAVSNHPAWMIAELRAESRRVGAAAPRVHQFMYNLLARDADGEYARFARTAGLHNVVYNPLAGGLLTGRYTRTGAPPSSGRFTQQLYLDRYWHPSLLEAAARVVELAREAGLAPVELAYRWLAGAALVDAVIVGASSIGQLEENLNAAARPPLEPGLQARCDEVWEDLRGPVPRYWR